MTLGRCPLSIFCSRGILKSSSISLSFSPESITGCKAMHSMPAPTLR